MILVIALGWDYMTFKNPFNPNYYMILNWKPQPSGQREAQFWTTVLTYQLSNLTGRFFFQNMFQLPIKIVFQRKEKTWKKTTFFSVPWHLWEIPKFFLRQEIFMKQYLPGWFGLINILLAFLSSTAAIPLGISH